MSVQSISIEPSTATSSVKSAKRVIVIQGHAKNFYSSEKPDVIIQEFKSNGVEDGKKRSKHPTLGSLKNQISSYLFEYLEGFHIPTHYVRKVSDREMMVWQLKMIPISVCVYNYASGDLARRIGLPEGKPLEFPVFEHYYKSAPQAASWINEYHVFALGLTAPDEFKQINRIASKVNAVLRALCDRRRLKLVSMRLEFGRHKGQIVVGDEISPSTCEIWDASNSDPAKQTRYSADDERAIERFSDLLDRLSLKA